MQTLTYHCAVVQDYPEHRLQFFNLLHAITKHCFTTLFTMSPSQLKLVIDSIVWCPHVLPALRGVSAFVCVKVDCRTVTWFMNLWLASPDEFGCCGSAAAARSSRDF